MGLPLGYSFSFWTLKKVFVRGRAYLSVGWWCFGFSALLKDDVMVLASSSLPWRLERL
jgi:hypothetical protein